MSILGRLAVLGVTLCTLSAVAQTYPAKPIRIVCAFPVGGIADIYARISEGARFVAHTPEALAVFVKVEIAKWAPVVKASGARVD
jgi:tripartite-type tricarboxylate transporter receptor subunit TctC